MQCFIGEDQDMAASNQGIENLSYGEKIVPFQDNWSFDSRNESRFRLLEPGNLPCFQINLIKTNHQSKIAFILDSKLHSDAQSQNLSIRELFARFRSLTVVCLFSLQKQKSCLEVPVDTRVRAIRGSCTHAKVGMFSSVSIPNKAMRLEDNIYQVLGGTCSELSTRLDQKC